MDLEEAFVWFDDNPFIAEITILENAGRGNALIQVDLSRDRELLSVIQQLEEVLP